MYAEKQAFNPMSVGGAIGQQVGYVQADVHRPISAPVQMTALQEASEGMDRSISEALSLAEMLASRLSHLMMAAPPSTLAGDNKQARSYSPYVENVMRQRSRVDAISAQLGDILSRLEA